MEITSKSTNPVFLATGFIAGGILAFLQHFYLLSPAFMGLFGVNVKTGAWTFMPLLFNAWVFLYATFLLFSYPFAQSIARWLLITLIPSFLAALPFAWQSHAHLYAVVSGTSTLCFFSAFALNAFHLHYQANGTHKNYHTLFSAVWNTIVQLIIALIFLLLCLIIFYLLSSLFTSIGMNFLRELLNKGWFLVWTGMFLFSVSLLITTKTQKIVEQTCTILIMVCKYLFPVLSVVGIVFLIAILFTYLFTHHAIKFTGASYATLAFISAFFLNAIYQDGNAENPYPIWLAWICRIFTMLTPILALFAMFGVYVESANSIDLKGWNIQNFHTFTTTALLFIYTFLYSVIAFQRKKTWLQSIEKINIALGFLLIVITLLTLNPLILGIF